MKPRKGFGLAVKYYSLTIDKEGCHQFYYQHVIADLAKKI